MLYKLKRRLIVQSNPKKRHGGGVAQHLFKEFYFFLSFSFFPAPPGGFLKNRFDKGLFLDKYLYSTGVFFPFSQDFRTFFSIILLFFSPSFWKQTRGGGRPTPLHCSEARISHQI